MAALIVVAIISVGFGIYLELASRASNTTWYIAVTGGSDSNPCTQTAPCLSFDRAYRVAAAGDTVQVAGGVYNTPFKNAAGNTMPGEVINWDATKAKATNNVVFQPAPGAAVTVNGNIRVFASHVTFQNMSLVDPTNSQNKYDAEVYNYDTNGSPSGNDVGWITFQNITARNFEISAAHDVSVLGGSYGPTSACQSDSYAQTHYASKPQYGGGNNAIRPEPGAPDPYNITVDGATIHNVMSYDLVGCHTEGIAIFSGSSNMTIKNSKFYGNDVYDILAQANSGSGTLGQITLENNWFAASTNEAGTGSGSWGAELDSISKNVTIANNSFNFPLLFQDPASNLSSVSIVGNILPGPVAYSTSSGAVSSMCGKSGVTAQYNITAPASGQSCTTNTNANTSSVSSLYTNPANDATMNYAPKAGSTPNPIGFVPTSASPVTNDIDYHCRPASGQTNIDAGASELNATGSCGNPITGSGSNPPPPPPPSPTPTPPSPPPTPPAPSPTPPLPGCTTSVNSTTALTNAVNSAASGSTVCIAGGSYGATTWDGGSNRTSKVVVKPATPNDIVTFTGKLTISGAQIELQNVSMPGQQYLILAPAHDIQMTNVNTGSFEIQANGSTGTNNITLKGGSVGPWHSYPDDRIDSGGGTAPNTHILIDGVTFHDQTRSNTSDHFECLQVWAADGLTIQNSTFTNCSVFSIFIQSAGSGQPAAPTNVVIQNNFIDCCTDYLPNAQGVPTNSYYKNYAIMLPSDHQEGTWKNVTIRNNTFDDKLDFGSGPAVAFSNVNVKNNIAPGIDYQQNPMTSPVSGLNVDYNLWFSGSKIGSHDLNNASTSSLFANYAALNFHLVTGALAIDKADDTAAPTAADPPANFYPPSGSYPLTDIDGNTRPQGAGPDIGADEFAGTSGGDTQKPTAPSNLAATATSSTAVKLNWTAATDNVGVTGYKIYRGGMTTALATVSGSTTTYTDNTVQPNTAYSYQVTAIDAAANEGPGSNTVNITTPPTPDTTPPNVSVTAPANGSSVTGTITLSATASDASGISKVEFYVDGTLLALGTASPYTTPWNTNPVSAGSHTILAKAYDNAGNTANSSTVSVTVTHPDTTPPTAPSGLSAQATSPTGVALTWTAATDNVGVTGYLVKQEGVVIGNTTTAAYPDNTVTGSSTYHYTVFAVDAAGNVSPASNTATVTTPAPPDTTPPAAPSSLTAIAISPTQVNLAWQAAADPSGIKGYNVYRNGQKITTSPTTATTYGDGTAATATSYTYTVTAVDGAGNESTKSTPAAVTTPPTSPVITTISTIPSDDSFIEQQYPNRQHGTAKTLQVRGSSAPKDTLLKFKVSGVSGRTVSSAKLSLYVTEGAPSGVSLYPITPTSIWSEATVTWNTRPSYVSTNLLGTLGRIRTGQVVQVDITKLITADGTYGIFMTNSSTHQAAFASKEYSGHQPKLTLTVQ